jgi:hypothetical protein
MERRKRKEQRIKDAAFFRVMEENILASLARGELLPTIPLAETVKQGPPQEPLVVRPAAIRVRTISNMNERLLSDLRDDNENSARDPRRHPHVVVAPVAGPPLEGRPPLPQRRPGNPSTQKQAADPDPFELSPEIPSRTYEFKSQMGSDSDALQGEFLLDEPILDESTTAEQLHVYPTNENVARPAAITSHQRRNTGGTIFVKSTMENPDIKSTIQCVCGVYRAHIVESSKQKRQDHVNIDVFRDDYEHPHPRKVSSQSMSIPKLSEIESFYETFYKRSQMEHDTIVMSIIYVERLIKETNGVLSPTPESWASILLSCMILASKVWDDLSMWNIDFSNVSLSPGMTPFSLKRINQLEIAVLTCLNFNVRVPASEYAKYYFLIRTMLTRSGMLDHATAPLNKEEAKLLESRTYQYQNEQLKGNHDRERARSFDFNLVLGLSRKDAAGPVLNDKACLEQLVSLDRK